MNEHELRDALRRTAAPDASAARDRAWHVVRAAYAEREQGRSRRGLRRWVTVAVVLVGTAGATVATAAPNSGVGKFVRDSLGLDGHARAALVRVPGGGRLLVQTGRDTWVVSAAGARRRLGAYDGASWSPRGLFVVAWRGGVLSAVEPTGRLRWSLSRPNRITAARWSPGDGYRIAYVNGPSLRVVNGDGTGDHQYGVATSDVAPAWRPDGAHVLAYVDVVRRIRVVAVDSRQQLWRTGRQRSPVALAWSPRGTRLLLLERTGLTIYDAAGRRLARLPLRGAVAAAWSPTGAQVAIVRTIATTGGSELLLIDLAHGSRTRSLLRGPGRFGTPAWSPDGSRVLLPWPDAGQWLFLRPTASKRSVAIANIARQFTPGATRPPFPRAVTWCCPR